MGNYFESRPAELASWALPATLAVPIWYFCWKWAAQRDAGSNTETDRPQLPWRNTWAVLLTIFFGGPSTVFFFVLTWLAPRYVALGWKASQAGLLLSVFLLTQIGGDLAVSAVGDRLTDQRPLFGMMLFLIVGGALGVALAPRFAPWIWAIALGIGAGGLFTLALTLPVMYAASPTATDGLTSLMLGGGYLIAVLGPFVAGIL